MMNDEPEGDSEIHPRMTPSALDIRHSTFNIVKALREEISLAVLAPACRRQVLAVEYFPGREVRWMERFMVPRIAHCGSGHP